MNIRPPLLGTPGLGLRAPSRVICHARPSFSMLDEEPTTTRDEVGHAAAFVEGEEGTEGQGEDGYAADNRLGVRAHDRTGRMGWEGGVRLYMLCVEDNGQCIFDGATSRCWASFSAVAFVTALDCIRPSPRSWKPPGRAGAGCEVPAKAAAGLSPWWTPVTCVAWKFIRWSAI